MTQYRTTAEIVIPIGTILNRAPAQLGGAAYVEAAIGFGVDFSGSLVVQVHPDALESGFFEESQP